MSSHFEYNSVDNLVNFEDFLWITTYIDECVLEVVFIEVAPSGPARGAGAIWRLKA